MEICESFKLCYCYWLLFRLNPAAWKRKTFDFQLNFRHRKKNNNTRKSKMLPAHIFHTRLSKHTYTLTYSVSWWNCWWFSIKPMAKLIHILFFTFMPNISIAADWALFRILTKMQSTILYQSIAGIDIYDFIAEADFHILSRFSAISVVHYVGESLGHQFGRSRYNWVNFSTSTQLCWTFLAENVK